LRRFDDADPVGFQVLYPVVNLAFGAKMLDGFLKGSVKIIEKRILSGDSQAQ
jgi:hypothetical protein